MTKEEKNQAREELLQGVDSRIGTWPVHLAKWFWWCFMSAGILWLDFAFEAWLKIDYLSALAFVLLAGCVMKFSTWLSAILRHEMIRSRMKLAGAFESRSYEEFQEKVLNDAGLGFTDDEFKSEEAALLAEIAKLKPDASPHS